MVSTHKKVSVIVPVVPSVYINERAAQLNQSKAALIVKLLSLGVKSLFYGDNQVSLSPSHQRKDCRLHLLDLSTSSKSRNTDKMLIWHQFTLNVKCQPWVLGDKQSPWSNNQGVGGLHAAWQINKGSWLMTTRVIQVPTFWWSISSVIVFSIMHDVFILWLPVCTHTVCVSESVYIYSKHIFKYVHKL